MQKLYIAKNKYGGYYTKIENKYNRVEKILSVSLPKDTVLPNNFGTYTCDFYVDVYKNKKGDAEVVLRITKISGNFGNVANPDVNPQGSASINPYEEYDNSIEEELPW